MRALRHLPVNEWPEADREAFCIAYQPGDVNSTRPRDPELRMRPVVRSGATRKYDCLLGRSEYDGYHQTTFTYRGSS